MAKRNRTPFNSTLLTITFVLFFVGCFAFIAILWDQVLSQAKSDLEYKITLKDRVSDKEALKLVEEFKDKRYVLAARYVSKEAALEAFSKENDEDFQREMMDDINPLPSSINLKLKSEFINLDSLRSITNEILIRNREFRDVVYPMKLIHVVDKRAAVIRIGATVLGILLLGVSFMLIANSVRLAIFAQRLAIRSMQLVGATAGYIRKPFLRIGVIQGVLAGTLASLLLFLLIRGASSLFKSLGLSSDIISSSLSVILLFICLILFGGLIGLLSSFYAVNKYLNKDLEKIA